MLPGGSCGGFPLLSREELVQGFRDNAEAARQLTGQPADL